MIYCFSGTGNSRFVARLLADGLGAEMHSMCEARPDELDFMHDAMMGFVFPVYGWRLPNAVKRFVEGLPVYPPGFDGYVFAVLTCGDDIGRTDCLLRKALARKGWPLHAVFSVQMRNTYVCLPGFDVDSAEVEKQKRDHATGWLRGHVLPSIQNRIPSTSADIHPGACPWLKTYVLGPMFHSLLTKPRYFKVSSDCNGCGRCAKVCPLHNISYADDSRPVWQEHCTHCLACYHSCPHHAIGYGPFTHGKGQVRVLPSRDN